MNDPAPRRRGRRPAGQDTRGAIVAAARTVFATKGYEAATVRGIARAAAVDPRLVHHYYASKEEIFVEAMDFPVLPTLVIAPAVEQGTDGIGERMVRVFFSVWDGPEQRERVVALLGSAMSSPEAARMLREFIAREIMVRVAAALGVPDPQLRVELAVAQMIGVAVVRYVVQMEPLASAPVEQLVPLLAPTLQRYLTGDPAGGDLAGGDPAGGDPAGGDPAGGDPATR